MSPRLATAFALASTLYGTAVAANEPVRVAPGRAQYGRAAHNGASVEYTDRIVGHGLTRETVNAAQASSRLRVASGTDRITHGMNDSSDRNDGHGHLSASGIVPTVFGPIRGLVGGSAEHDVVGPGQADMHMHGRFVSASGYSNVTDARNEPNGETSFGITHHLSINAGYYPQSGAEALLTAPMRLGWQLAKAVPVFGLAPRLAESVTLRLASDAFAFGHALTVRPADGYGEVINDSNTTRPSVISATASNGQLPAFTMEQWNAQVAAHLAAAHQPGSAKRNEAPVFTPKPVRPDMKIGDTFSISLSDGSPDSTRRWHEALMGNPVYRASNSPEVTQYRTNSIAPSAVTLGSAWLSASDRASLVKNLSAARRSGSLEYGNLSRKAYPKNELPSQDPTVSVEGQAEASIKAVVGRHWQVSGVGLFNNKKHSGEVIVSTAVVLDDVHKLVRFESGITPGKFDAIYGGRVERDFGRSRILAPPNDVGYIQSTVLRELDAHKFVTEIRDYVPSVDDAILHCQHVRLGQAAPDFEPAPGDDGMAVMMKNLHTPSQKIKAEHPGR